MTGGGRLKGGWATPGKPKGDLILLEGMVFYGFHGTKAAERELGQRFVVDMEVGLDLLPAARSDDLAQTANYAAMFRVVESIVTGSPANLIETIAERIATAILGQFPVDWVRVRIRKPQAPLPGVLAGPAVEITRYISDLAGEGARRD